MSAIPHTMVGEDSSVPYIEDTVELDPDFPTVSQRYYTRYYYVPKRHVARGPRTPTAALEQPDARKTGSDSTDTFSMLTTEKEFLPCKKMKLSTGESSDKMDMCSVNTKGSNGLSCASSCQERKDATSEQIHEDIISKMGTDISISDEITVSHSRDASVCTKSNVEQSSVQTNDQQARKERYIDPEEQGQVLQEKVQNPREFDVTGEETLVMTHSNKLCLVSLSPYHPVVRDSLEVTKVEFDVFGVDRLNNQVSGKGKRGAQVLGSKSTLCRIHTRGGATYNVTSGARGKLLQVNEQLIETPDLCRVQHGADGWLAVVLPRLQDFDALISAMVPAEEYEAQWGRQSSQRTDIATKQL